MSNIPEISICIPAYKRLEYLERLLNSIAIQNFKNYEVIITDDSPDLSVSLFLENFRGIEKIYFHRNLQQLGTPENWNESIRKANGNWIKLMHDDDWFASENSLQLFFDATKESKNCSFIFSAHNDVEEISGKISAVHMGFFGKLLLRKSPLNLLKTQYIGAPSNTLIKRDVGLLYDNQFKWVVDFEYYIRCLQKTNCFYYVNKTLVNIGINKEQVTVASFRNPEVEIPENHAMLKKLGNPILRNICVYDYYWRFYRNLKIKNEEMVVKYYSQPLNPLLIQIMQFQNKIGFKILQNGILSKTFMIMNYLVSLTKKIQD